MVGSLMKMLAYSHAPRTTFALRHPVKSVRLGRFKRDLIHKRAPRVAAIGAAVLALPIGFLLGRKADHRNRIEVRRTRR
jgi:hypothetical protein